MKANPDAIVGLQANETFLLTALNNGALGTAAETTGFAKYQFNENMVETSSEAYLEAEAEYKEAQRPATRLVNAKQNLKNAHDDITALNGLPHRTQEQEQALAAALESVPHLEQALVQQRVETVAALKARVPEDQHEQVDACSDEQIIERFSATNVDLAQKANHLKEVNKGFNTTNDTSANLFPPTVTPPSDRGLLSRSVASSQVDKLLGTGIIAEESFGIDKDGKLVGVSIQADGAGITGKYRGEDDIKRDCLLEVDLTDPDIQRGLADLEAVDYITGQIDRHCGNIFVDPQTKKVTGIDNDLAFPEMSRKKMFENAPSTKEKAVVSMPSHMHVETARKIMAVTPEELRATLENMPAPDGAGKLGPAAIDSACERLAELQSELQKPDGKIRVVEKFDKNTYMEAMAAQEAALKVATEGVDLMELTSNHLVAVDSCAKTSYLGAAELQAKKYELGMKAKPDEFGMRPMESAQKAVRSPAVLIKQVNQLQQEIATLEANQKKYQGRLAKLESPTAKDRLQALAHGGVKSAHKFFQAKDNNAYQQLKEKSAQLDKVLQSAPDGLQDALYKQVGRQKPAITDSRPVFQQRQQEALGNPQVEVPQNQNLPAPVELDLPKAAKQNIPAKDKNAGLPAAEDELDVSDLDHLNDDLEAKVEVETKKEGLQRRASVGDMLRAKTGNLALAANGQDVKPNSLRASGSWQAAKPTVVKPAGGNSLSKSH